MGKSLLNKLGKGVRTLAIIGTAVASIGFAGCKLPMPDPVNYAPKAVLMVADKGGNDYDITLTGQDQNGDSDIVEYTISIDKGNDGIIDISKSNTTPFSINEILDNNTTVYGKVTDSQGQTSETEYPNKYVISGTLESNENDNIPVDGEVRVYINGNEDLRQRDNDGKDFSFSVPQNSNVKIQGMIQDVSNMQESYVRTISLDDVVSNNAGIKVRCVPYDGLDSVSPIVSTSDFKKHIDEVAINASGLEKYNVPNIEILTNYNGVQFSSEDLITINSKANEWKTIISNAGGPAINIPDPNLDPSVSHYHGYNSVDNGWLVIIPYLHIIDPKTGSEVNGLTITNGSGAFYTIGRAETYLNPSVGLGGVTSHEIGLGESFIGEATTLNGDQTIMRPIVNLISPSVIDIKAADIVYEPTYEAGESLDNILGDNFY